MRIAWLTPLSTASAIGKVTTQIAGELRQAADVDLWSADRGELHDSPVPVIRYAVTDPFERMLRLYDAVLYNFGDHYGFHREVFEMARRVPGIAILHDYVMHHFFMGHYLEDSGRIDAYVATMTRLYGTDGGDAARASFERVAGEWRARHTPPPVWETDRVVDFPLFENLLHNVAGVVVHADYFRKAAQAATDAPVARLFLPNVQRPGPATAPDALRIPPGRAVLLTVGHVNINKRIREIIEVLGRNPDLAGRVLYVVAGPLPAGAYTSGLRDTIAKFGLEPFVRLTGVLSEPDLHAWLEHADICVNLRHPVMEGASASLADQLAFGKPVVVTNAGVYAELPDSCVVKVDPGREIEDLPAVLRRLLDDRTARLAMAARGREYASTHFRADRYAAELIQFIEASGGFAAMARYADSVGSTLGQMGVQPGMPIVQTIARESALLFSDPKTSPWRPGGKPGGAS